MQVLLPVEVLSIRSTGEWYLAHVTDANTNISQMDFTPASNYDLDAATLFVNIRMVLHDGAITFDVTPVNDTPTAAYTHTVTYTEDDSSVVNGHCDTEVDNWAI